MKDTIKLSTDVFAGIPDTGTRVVVLVVTLFVIAVGILLIYSRMQDFEDSRRDQK